MADIHKLPTRFIMTTTPAELRKLADKMQTAFDNRKLGESVVVETWYGPDVEIQIAFDQEKCTRNQYCCFCEKNTNDNKQGQCEVCHNFRRVR